jgi:hypothetical protein
MQRVPFALTAWDDNEYGLPTVELVNLYPEQMPHLGAPRLVPTPGLTLFQAASTGVRGVFQSDGILSGQIVYADGTSLERVTSSGTNAVIDTVASDNYDAQFAASQADLVATSGGTAYLVESGSVTSITVGNASGDITSVAELGQRHLFVEDGSGRFWWSDVGDPTTVSATSFATAESEPDNLLSIQSYKGRIYLFGTATVEAWTPTGDQDAAFRSSPGAVLPSGLIGRDAVCQSDDSMFMVATTGQIFRLDGLARTRISTSAIEGYIKDLSASNQALVKLRSYQWRGHEFIRVTIPGTGAWNYDLLTGAWHRAKTLGTDTHIVNDFVQAFGTTYATGAGGIYSMSRTVYDEAGTEVRRVAQALVSATSYSEVERLTVYTSSENVPVTGQGSDPKFMLRVARDGVVFEHEILRDGPKAGQYAKRIEWGPLGRMEPPVFKIELAWSDPFGTTVSDCWLNMARS